MLTMFQVCRSVALNTFILLYNHVHYLSSELFHQPKLKLYTH